jgi:hypothetical protein
MMRLLFKTGVLALAGVGAKSLYDKYLAGSAPDAPLFPQGPIDLSRDDVSASAAPPARPTYVEYGHTETAPTPPAAAAGEPQPSITDSTTTPGP